MHDLRTIKALNEKQSVKEIKKDFAAKGRIEGFFERCKKEVIQAKAGAIQDVLLSD